MNDSLNDGDDDLRLSLLSLLFIVVDILTLITLITIRFIIFVPRGFMIPRSSTKVCL